MTSHTISVKAIAGRKVASDVVPTGGDLHP